MQLSGSIVSIQTSEIAEMHTGLIAWQVQEPVTERPPATNLQCLERGRR